MTKLNEETINELATCISEGMTNKDACIVAGVAESTFYGWLNQPSNEMEKSLAQQIDRARVVRKMKLLQTIFNAAENGVWQAAAWYLERAYPEEFGKPDRYHDQGITAAVDAVKELTASIKAKAEAPKLEEMES